ncbi:UNVERIFIED_CONTAM: hypothetical protein Sradi_5252900 [Sesamum radiatum]|uniref:Uncharacterized protein n=1 Tax=Sesamum radiatum TaxID=300843 RepID=A0AAW2LN90_SESRA
MSGDPCSVVDKLAIHRGAGNGMELTEAMKRDVNSSPDLSIQQVLKCASASMEARSPVLITFMVNE